jgi:hypothetical protein
VVEGGTRAEVDEHRVAARAQDVDVAGVVEADYSGADVGR